MDSTDNEQRQRATSPRRTAGDRERRRNLADVAAGVGAAGGAASTAAARIERFRVVLYLCGAADADLDAPRRECHEYAEAFGWEIAAEIEDRDVLGRPDDRPGLKRAIGHVERKEAGAVLTARRSMVSTTPAEYHEVARGVEKRGGFLHAMDPATDPATDPASDRSGGGR